MADTQIVAGGVKAAPLAYTIPGAQEIIVKAAFATFDGSGAATAFLPCVRVLAPGNKVVGEYVTDATVAAAGSAEVSWAPFLRGAAAANGTTSLPQAFAGRIASDETLTKNTTTTVTFDSLTTNDATVFTGLDGASQVVSVASSGVYLVWARIEFNVTNDGTHELVVVASATPGASAMSRVVKSDLAGQDQRFSKDTFWPLALATYQLETSAGDTGQFSLQFVSTGAAINATGRGRLHMIRLGDLMV